MNGDRVLEKEVIALDLFVLEEHFHGMESRKTIQLNIFKFQIDAPQEFRICSFPR